MQRGKGLLYFVVYHVQFLPRFLREVLGCALYVGIVTIYHGYNNPMYNALKNMVCIIHGNIW